MDNKSTRFALASLIGVMAVGGVAAQDATPEVTPEMTPEAVQETETEIAARPYIGIRVVTNDEGAVVIDSIVEGSPADVAGLQVGDVIVGVNGAEIAVVEDVVTLVQAQAVGDTLTLDIERAGDPISVELTLAAMPDEVTMEVVPDDGRPGRGDRDGRGGRGNGMPDMRMMPGNSDMFFMMMSGAGRLGVTFQPLDETVAAENNVSLTDGAYIVEVAADSPAAAAGLAAGDVVTAVNGEPVDAERTLRDRLIAYEPGDTVTLTVVRGEETLDIEVTLGEQEMTMMEGIPFDRDGFFFQMPVPPMVEPTPEATAEPNA